MIKAEHQDEADTANEGRSRVAPETMSDHYSDPDADVSMISSDKVVFKLHSYVLQNAS